MNSPLNAFQWHSPLLPPERLEPLEIQLDENTVKRAVWTGAKWWCEGREVTPRAWRPFAGAMTTVSA